MISGNQDIGDDGLASVYRKHGEKLDGIEKSFRQTLKSSNSTSISALIDFGVAATRRRTNLTKLFMGLFSGIDANIAAMAERNDRIQKAYKDLEEEVSKRPSNAASPQQDTPPPSTPSNSPPRGPYIN